LTVPSDSSADKGLLRKEARTRRAELVRSCTEFAVRIARFADNLALEPNAVVAGYWPTRDEADPRLLMKALAASGATLALPRIEARNAALSFRRWSEGDPLADNHHAIQEPLAEAPRVTPDLVLVPLLAFDARGHRLGYGGGYYDRTLCGLRAAGPVTAIGIAYAGQEIAAIPHEANDQRLDMVLTELGLRRFS
jgi:5-formyltetrahydrofolate cyclo-ligase